MQLMADRDVQYLESAARLALRGHGGAEPNPLVGCVIVSSRGETVGWGYHRQFGGPHAEIVALQRAGKLAKGATLYCTLEPCNHQGKTGPCTQAIIEAKIGRVVIARRDPYPPAAGGVERLRAAGIKVELIENCQAAVAVSDPFVHRLKSGLPWVTVKWAQTLDGKIATRTGESKWISNEASRKMVHRERGRVDVILTGIGTVLKDDPMLTARNVRVRRVAKRVVVDPKLQIPLHSKLFKTMDVAPTIVVCDEELIDSSVAKHLRDRGAQLMGMKMNGAELPLEPMLRELSSRYDAQHVMVEAGTGLMSRLFRQKLVDEAWAFIAPKILGDASAPSFACGIVVERIRQGIGIAGKNVRQRLGDIIVRGRVEH
jgi:diaminohydroxyphosphoribosylaminopyrimidine deaminase/5-amino-6-(5-phosphoribosylamino)uracil reductase